MVRQKLITLDEARTARQQHLKPCEDCPMRLNAIPGWLGGSSPEEYCRLAHSDALVPCHAVRGMHCAGMAIYRANVVKRVDFPNLVLAPDTDQVFATPMEFLARHGGSHERK